MSIRSILPLATIALSGLASAFSDPTEATWGPLYQPDLETPVTQGETFTVVWDPEDHDTDGVTVSLVLCKGNSDNCVPQTPAIAEGLNAADKEYEWDVPCNLAPGTQKTSSGYGMLIIVDGTGEFQYSTQFSVKSNPKCGGSSTTGSATATASNSTATSTGASWLIGDPVSVYSTTDSDGKTLVQTKTFSEQAEEATYVPTWTGVHGGGYGDQTSATSTATATPVAGTTSSRYQTPTGTTASPAGATTSSVQDFDGAAAGLRWNTAGLLVALAAAVFAL